tara:strand:- start:1078 stop:1218 length:141 start_codon:yes stop_codon:yes gene_type:complete
VILEKSKAAGDLDLLSGWILPPPSLIPKRTEMVGSPLFYCSGLESA